MTSRERLLAAYRCEEPDRVPVRVWGVMPGSKPVHPSFQPIIDAVHRTDLVDGWSPPCGIFLTGSDRVSERTERKPSQHEDYEEVHSIFTTPDGELRCIDLASSNGKPGYRMKHLIESRDDAKRFLSIPYEPVRGDLSGFFEMRRLFGDDGLIVTSTTVDPMYHIAAHTGSELFAIWSVEERELLTELIEAMNRRVTDLVKYMLAGGVGPVFGYVGPELCIPPLQSVNDFHDFVVKVEKPVVDLVHDAGGMMWVHCHGKMGPVLDGFLEMGIDCLNPIEPPPMGDLTLAEAKTRVAGRMCLEGNIEQGDFYRCTEDEMRDLVREAIRQGAPGGGFILCPTSSPWQTATLSDQAVRNYLTFIDAGLEFGRYPIRL